jgi:hypothetical protein
VLVFSSPLMVLFGIVELGLSLCCEQCYRKLPPPLHPRNPAPSESSMEASPEARFRISKARSEVQNGRFLMNLVGLLLYSSISLTSFVELYLGSDSMT